ncbi:hypothetical protein NIES2135_27190 [Leptolyngbya boryana NIES-2135]|jgi:hypothetical protein|uniref:Uncharacterized protein n=1 Tax=Leptolyngbya boryana NIES-2135 TaxID=1973484 RepID=A0A1Z4JGK1_LEPBY|nr:hypothetical protein NIES2135_27190 [Leptolyngbya boryana NIES-2135]
MNKPQLPKFLIRRSIPTELYLLRLQLRQSNVIPFQRKENRHAKG